MNYLGLFTPHNLALLSDWLAEAGELYVDVYEPKRGGSGTPYFIRSLQDFKGLVTRQTWPVLCLTVFHHRQYPVRGVADEQLLEQALTHVPDGQWYESVSLEHSECYQASARWFRCGCIVPRRTPLACSSSSVSFALGGVIP